jgi:O-antigen/teichoic acid export membrane protein
LTRSSPEFARPLGEVSVSRRGAAAMFYVVSWGFANHIVTFLGSLVLARLLAPRDFGMIALGQTVALLATAASEGGIASGFIRQSHGISRGVLRSINGVQFLIALTVATVVTPLALAFGLAGSLAALIVWSLPIASLQTAGRVVLARDLRFRDISVAESASLLAYYVWSIAGVMAGYGVWSLASGMLVRAAASTLTVGGLVGWQILMPSLSRYRDVLGVIGFGIRFSLTTLTNVLYEQGRNIVIAVIAGTYTLGLWALAARVLQVMFLIYLPIHALGFPAFSQLIASGRNPRPVLERVARLTFAASALMLPAALVAIPGVITTLFGSQWADAALVFPGIVLALFIGAPVAGPCMYFLYAMGRPADVFKVTLLGVLTNLACIALLLSLVGLAGVGFGTVPGAAVESIVLGHIVRKMNGAELFSAMPRFLLASLLAVAGGVAVTSAIDSDVVGALLGAGTAFTIAGVICVLTARSVLLDLVSVGRRSVSMALAGER